jgi:hypothetical protein
MRHQAVFRGQRKRLGAANATTTILRYMVRIRRAKSKAAARFRGFSKHTIGLEGRSKVVIFSRFSTIHLWIYGMVAMSVK